MGSAKGGTDTEPANDRTVVVTGSSSGIGEAIARRFADEGANVVVNSRSQERAESVAGGSARQAGRPSGLPPTSATTTPWRG